MNLGTLDTGTDASITLSSTGTNRFVVSSYIDQSVSGGSFTSLSSNGAQNDTIIYAPVAAREIGVLNNFKDGWIAADSFYRFRYMSYVQAKVFNGTYSDAATALTDDLHVILGERASGTLPTTRKSFTVRVRGAVWNQDDPYGNTYLYRDIEFDPAATAIYDPSASASQRMQIAFSMPLALYQDRGRTQVTGMGSVGSDGYVQGTLTSPDSDYRGQFFGRFYGPSGVELGLIIGLSHDTGIPARATGVLLGK